MFARARALQYRATFFRVRGEREGFQEEGIALDAAGALAYIDEGTLARALSTQSEAS